MVLQKQFLLLSSGPILQTFLGGKVVSLMKLFLPAKLFVVQGFSESAPIIVNLLEQKDFCALFSKTISGRTHLKRKDWASICVTLTAGPFVSEINVVLVFAEFNNYCLFGWKLEEMRALVLFMFIQHLAQRSPQQNWSPRSHSNMDFKNNITDICHKFCNNGYISNHIFPCASERLCKDLSEKFVVIMQSK